MAAPKNRMLKSRKTDDPYLVFQDGAWQWKVLKAYQGDNAKPYARFFCAVTSPFTPGSYDLGDVYVKEIVDAAAMTYADPELFDTEEERGAFMHNLNAARLRAPAEFGG